MADYEYEVVLREDGFDNEADLVVLHEDCFENEADLPYYPMRIQRV